MSEIIPSYDANSSLFTLKVHHSGKFINIGENPIYCGGYVQDVHFCDVERLTLFELDGILVQDLKLIGPFIYYIKWAGSNVLEEYVETDTYLQRNIKESVKKCRVLEVFVGHSKVFESQGSMLTEAVSDLGLVVEPTVGLVDGAGCSEPSLCGGDGVGCSRPNITNDIEDSFDDEAAYEYEGDPEYEQCHDDLIVDETAEIHLKGLGKRPMDIDMEDAQLDDFDNEYIQQNSSSSEEDTDDELKNLHKCKRSSMKAKLPKLPEFNVDVDMKNPSFEVGLVFSSGKEFKDAVREYAIMNGKEIFFKVNDSHRVRAKCRGIQCPWMCFASKINSDSSTFAIKSYIDVHKCSRKKHNRFATAKWFSNKYLTEFKSNENWKISSFMEKVSKDHPISKVQPGRPKRSRKLEFDEMVPPTGTKMKRRYIIIKCSGCGAKGHNFRTCVRNKEKNSDVNPSNFTQEINNVAPRYKQKTGKKKIVTSQFGQLGQEYIKPVSHYDISAAIIFCL
ncbi:hypothetical protein F8388_011311 [Cannabis sativa]|uniref:Transposase MuDR plant domain-containing protein n=1 Tax=Cannabis sativa TaxID=3483 RepID=A0A7J6FAL2_CANSA|nr:hypothetical protein F8388_011311 [Cannabis sativa]